jgi:hypothetical protein
MYLGDAFHIMIMIQSSGESDLISWPLYNATWPSDVIIIFLL